MINNQRILAVITARSGSKSIKDKNIRLLAGKPLLAYTISAARESNVFDEIFVSTDSEKYAEIAKKYGASVPFLRRSDLATDSASSWDVVKDSLLEYRNRGRNFDIAVLLQPTSPLRSSEDIVKAFDEYFNKNANAVISICEAAHSPLWMNTLPPDKIMTNFIKNEIKNKPRQLLEKYYQLNGAIYIAKADYLFEYNDIYHDKCYAYIMPKERSVDIDSEMDFLLAEMILSI